MNMPLMIDLTNKNVVIVGGGLVASRLAQTLSHTLTHNVISPEITQKLQNMVDKGVVIWKKNKFEPSDIVDAYLVIAERRATCQ